MTILGERIKRLRMANGLTQTELAEKINSSQKQIWKYESGQNEPSSGVLLNIATSLNTSADYLLGLTNNPEGYIRDTGDLTDKEKAIVKAVRSGSLENVVKTFMEES